MRYILQIFRFRSFREDPLGTLWRAATWILFHIIPRRAATIRIAVGKSAFRLCLPPLLHRGGSSGVFIQRQYYEPLLEFCDRLVAPGDVVFDCGANQGIFTCAFAALCGPGGRVVAFEPQAYAVAALENNLGLNGFGHVTVRQVATSDEAGTATLDTSLGAVKASIVRDFGRKGAFTVPTVTLTQVAQEIGIDRLDVIKMDIEGAEYATLLGARDLLDRFRPTVILEVSPNDASWSRIQALLQGYGYAAFEFGETGQLAPAREITDFEPCIVFLQPAKAPAG